ncbi:MAG: hypothetical protein U5N21_04455 [Rhodococcus sp. (in: high G+C Gram-positive bacteria)]|nr:hypothetical protein [Rhodococcus sp. (in: high G+C Gram-positive bacteria)]
MPIVSDLPLIQIVQLVVVAVVAVTGLPTAIRVYSERARFESRAKTALDLLDKTEPGMAGEKQIRSNAQRAVRQLAFLIEFPRTLRRRVPAISFAIFAVSAAVSQVSSVKDFNRYIQWALIVIELTAGWVCNRSMQNNARASQLVNRLFDELNAPTGLTFPKAKLFRRQRIPGITDVMTFAAAARDREADVSKDQVFLSSVEAANKGRVRAESEIAQLVRQLRRLKWKHRWMRTVEVPGRRIWVMYRTIRFRVIIETRLWRARRLTAQVVAYNPARADHVNDIYQQLRESVGKKPRPIRGHKPTAHSGGQSGEPASDPASPDSSL